MSRSVTPMRGVCECGHIAECDERQVTHASRVHPCPALGCYRWIAMRPADATRCTMTIDTTQVETR